MEESDLKYAKEIVTLDGKALPRQRWYSLFMILSQCTTEMMEELEHSNPGLLETFITITDSFVCANTYDNIWRFVEHNVAMAALRTINSRQR